MSEDVTSTPPAEKPISIEKPAVEKPAEKPAVKLDAKAEFDKKYSDLTDKLVKREDDDGEEKPTPEIENKPPVKFKVGDDEYDEIEVKALQKHYKAETPEKAIELATQNLKWKTTNAEEARKNNLTKAEAEQARKEALLEKEALVNSRKRVKEELETESKINKDYEAKINAKYDEIDALDRDDPKYERLHDDILTDIAELKHSRNQDLKSHKDAIEKLEKEEEGRKGKEGQLNISRLSQTYPEAFSDMEIFKEMEDWKKTEPDKRNIENFPALKTFLPLKKWAEDNAVVDLAKAYELAGYQYIAQKLQAESKETDKRIAAAEEAGYNKAIAEIKAKGTSFYESEDKNPKKIETVPPEKQDEKTWKAQWKGALDKLF